MILSLSARIRRVFLLLLLVILCTPPAMGQATASRPSILEISAQEMSEAPPFWQNHLHAAALMTGMLLEIYQDQEIYFLARDAGILYDLALLATQEEESVQRRLHFLWISRLTYEHPRLPEYLGQEGISEQRLRSGASYVLVDLGYEGTFSCLLRERWPEYSNRLKTHLMVSLGGPLCPEGHIASARSAMTAILGAGGVEMGRSAANELMKLEELPQHSDPAAAYVFEEGRWQVSTLSPAWDESYRAPGLATQLMADLKYRFEKGDLRDWIGKARQAWRRLMAPTRRGDREEVLRELKAMLESNDIYQKGVVLDYITTMKLNFRNELSFAPIRFAELGLEDLHLPYKFDSDPTVLFTEYPEMRTPFAEIFNEELTDQERQSIFSALLRRGQQDLIRKLFEVIANPADLIFPLAHALYQWMELTGETDFLKEMIAFGHRSLNQAIIVAVLSRINPVEHPDLFFDMIAAAVDVQLLHITNMILDESSISEVAPILDGIRAHFKDSRNLHDFNRILERHQTKLCEALFQ